MTGNTLPPSNGSGVSGAARCVSSAVGSGRDTGNTGSLPANALESMPAASKDTKELVRGSGGLTKGSGKKRRGNVEGKGAQDVKEPNVEEKGVQDVMICNVIKETLQEEKTEMENQMVDRLVDRITPLIREDLTVSIQKKMVNDVMKQVDQGLINNIVDRVRRTLKK